MPAADPEQSIFLAALELPTPAERAAYLKGACGADPALLANVQELLAAHEKDDGFLDRPPPNATVDVQPVTEGPGTLIGPYKLREQIGEGGMGVVYVAEQSHPVRRRVALKVIKPGMDTRQVVARFEGERQALAMMDHPNIAKVHDGGTTESGRPYFVMELVPGVPITEYCDGERLSVRQRLELFVLVCRAVQHAHQKGVIHRDLKPSNILVTLHDGVPVPKVIDFGVAKAMRQSLTDKTVYTALSQLVGTPLYMSPEQAEMNQLGVDTRSDVYSLGVLLYELLTGTTPFDKETLSGSGLEEMRRMIREDEPPRPSARVSSLQPQALSTTSQRRSTDPRRISAALHGELDWIVMKSLEKDRGRRYESASAFATDVRRYLDDEPVLAGPPSTMYRFHKFARKHRAALVTAVAIAASLILGTTASAWQAARATHAEAQANDNAAQAQEKAQEATTQRDEAKRQQAEAQRQRDEVKALNDKLAAKEQQLQRNLYAAHMILAQHAWEAGNADRTRELLEQHRPLPGETDLRHFEWYYLHRLSHAELLTLRAFSHSVAYSSDGKRLASASAQAGLKVWDAQTGQELLSLKGGSSSGNWTNCIAFSPDGKRLASVGEPGSSAMVKVWDAQSGEELLSLKGLSGRAHSVAFSPDGKRLAIGGFVIEQGKYAGEAKVWDTQTGLELLTVKGALGSLAFSPDGKRLASASKVWDAQTGQELLSLRGDTSVAYSPDGTRLASGGDDGTLKVWDAQTGLELLSIKGAHGGVVFSPDGKRLASASDDRTVKVWDAQTGQELFTFRGHSGSVWSVAFSPDGKRLVSGGDTVKVWDAQRDQKPLTLKGEATHAVVSVAFSPDGKRLASGTGPPYRQGPGEGKVWDTQTGSELFSLKGHTRGVNAVAFSPDGKRLASGSLGRSRATDAGEVKVWDAQTGQELLSLPFEGLTGFTTSVAFSPDGRRLASCGGVGEGIRTGTGEVRVWDAQTGQQMLTLKHSSNVHSVAFSPDGKRLASISQNLLQPQGEIKVWDAQTGQELRSFKGGGWIVVFSPDSKRLATASAFGDKTVKVWDAQTGQELLSFKGHADWVQNVVFSPDGKRLATASADKTIKVWDAQTGQELLTVEGHSGNDNGVAFSPDGHRLASGAAGGTVKIWDATPLPEEPPAKDNAR